MNMTRLNLTGPVTFDAGDEEIRWILGRPGFVTGPIGELLRKLGYEIERRYENEQAAVIIWMVRMYQQYGATWREEANEILRRARADGKEAEAEAQRERILTANLR